MKSMALLRYPSCTELARGPPHRIHPLESIHREEHLPRSTGYSIHIENFNIDYPGPDNIVLLESEKFDEEKLGYHSKVEWRNRIQKYWKMLPNSHQLSNKHIRRDNIQCVKSLKVKLFFYFFIFYEAFVCRFTQKRHNLDL